MSKFTKGIFYSILLTAGSIPAVSADEVFHEAVIQSLPLWSEVGIARVRALLPYTILVCVWYF